VLVIEQRFRPPMASVMLTVCCPLHDGRVCGMLNVSRGLEAVKFERKCDGYRQFPLNRDTIESGRLRSREGTSS
jgi:hypothetical protein